MSTIQTSPWGAVQHQKQIAEGIVSVSTAGHGGIWVSNVRRLQMPADCLKIVGYSGSPNWFEEDCDWSVVVLAFPDLFPHRDFYYAVRTCEGTDYLAGLVTPERKARADSWLKENAHLWESGGGMTKDGGWIASCRNLGDPTQRRNKWFPGVVVLPAVFTLEQFENAPLYKSA